MDKKICDNCEHYGMIDSGYGYCRKYPPVMVSFKDWLFRTYYQTMYPTIEWDTKACSKFQISKEG